jgi:hypothetical protein
MPNEEPRFEPLSDSERSWLDANMRVACSFVKLYAGLVHVEGVPAPEALDRAWTAWIAQWDATAAEGREDPNPIVNAVGVALGQHLVDSLALTWAVATDPYGTELAVHGDPGNVVVFPTNLVGKRFANRTTGFIAPLIEQLCADVRRIRQGT